MPWYQVDQRITGTAIPAGRPVPNDGYGDGIMDLPRAVNAFAYPLPADAPNPVYAKFRAWLAGPDGQAFAGQDGTPAAASSPASGGSPAGSLALFVIAAIAVLAAVGLFSFLGLRRRWRRAARDVRRFQAQARGWDQPRQR